jgi:hypothetical protein
MKPQKNSSQIIDLTIILALIITLVLIFLIFQDLVITNPISPWHDELWNLYASTEFFNHTQNLWPGCNQGMCLSIMGYKFPVLSGSYHGIIKSFLFLPIVMLYKIELIRIANIVLYFFPLFYIIKQKKYFGKTGCELIAASYFLLFIPLTFEAIFDQGQFIIPKLLFLIASIELVKEIQDHNPKRIVIIILLTTISLYEKLTNLPIAISIYISLGLILLNKDKKEIMKYGSLIGLIFIPYLIYFLYNFNFKNLEQFHQLTQAKNLDYFSNFSIIYESAIEFIFKQNYTLSSIFSKKINVRFPLVMLLIVVSCFILALVKSAKIQNKYSAIIVIFTPLLALLIYPFFDGLYRPWHFYSYTSLLIIPIAHLGTLKNNLYIKQKKIIVLVLLFLAIFNLDNIFKNVYRSDRARPFDQSLIKMAALIKTLPVKNIVCLDYSVCSNLIMQTNSEYKLLSDYSFSNKIDLCNNIQSLAKEDYLLITHNILDQKIFSYADKDLLYERSTYFNENCSKDSLELKEIKNVLNSEYSIYSHSKIN